jgi:hypothetical protein
MNKRSRIFEKKLKKNLYKIWNRMSSGSYFPPPVRTVKTHHCLSGGSGQLGATASKNAGVKQEIPAVESELQSLETAAVDQARYLQLAESLDGFRIKLRERAKTLDVCERLQILRLIVKEVLVAADSLTIRHSIPIPQTGPVSNGPQPTGSHPSGVSQKPSYLLCSRSS